MAKVQAGPGLYVEGVMRSHFTVNGGSWLPHGCNRPNLPWKNPEVFHDDHPQRVQVTQLDGNVVEQEY